MGTLPQTPPGRGKVGESLTPQILFLIFRVTMYDYQAMCRPLSHHPSAARPLVSVSVTPDLSSHPLASGPHF